MRKLWVIGLILIFVWAACGKKAEEKPEEPGPGLPGVTAGMMSTLTQFGSSLEKKDFAAAYSSLRAMVQDFWGMSPLFLRNVRFVKNDGNTFGIYEPRETEEYAPGEVIYLYMEPTGYTLKQNGQGKYDIGFAADMSIEDEKGEILGGQKDFGQMAFSSWNFSTEMCLTLTYTFSGLEKGRYKIVTTVRDVGSDKTATCEKWFSII
ncbi:MAG: hypothetical protein H6P98_1593 [Candidatus Aminicenantes bacterium]|nr:hypothetical protein [Candidatus Aminicenantes bacterium]